MFSFREAAASVHSAYFNDKTRLSKHLRRRAGPKVRRAHLWSGTHRDQLPATPLSKALASLPGRFHQTNSLCSLVIYVRLAAAFEQRDTEVDETNQRVKDADVNLNDLTPCKA